MTNFRMTIFYNDDFYNDDFYNDEFLLRRIFTTTMFKMTIFRITTIFTMPNFTMTIFYNADFTMKKNTMANFTMYLQKTQKGKKWGNSGLSFFSPDPLPPLMRRQPHFFPLRQPLINLWWGFYLFRVLCNSVRE